MKIGVLKSSIGIVLGIAFIGLVVVGIARGWFGARGPTPLSPEARAQASSSSPHSGRGLQKMRARFGAAAAAAAAVLSVLPSAVAAFTGGSSHAACPAATASARKAARASAGRRPGVFFEF